MILNIQGNDQRNEKKASILLTNEVEAKEQDDLLDVFTTSQFLQILIKSVFLVVLGKSWQKHLSCYRINVLLRLRY